MGAQRGVGLLELLIAMLVVAIGVLGISRMQLGVLRDNQGAMLRTQATLLAYDMIDRLRVDRQAALGGAYDIGFGADLPSGSSLVAVQLAEWLAGVRGSLPAADAAIQTDGDTVSISVRWDEARGDPEAEFAVLRTVAVL